MSKSHEKPFDIKKMGVLLSIQTIIICGWCQRNYVSEKTFTLSTIGVYTMRLYLATEVELSSLNKSDKFTVNDIKAYQNQIRKEVEFELLEGKTPKEINQRLLNESLAIITSRPFLTYQFFLRNIFDKLKGPMPWWVYRDTLPKHSLAYRVIPRLISFYTFITKACLLFIVCFSILLIILTAASKINFNSRDKFAYWSLLLTFIYFIVLGGFTFWTGPRIIFPVEFALICLTTIGFTMIWKIFNAGRRGEKLQEKVGKGQVFP